MRKGVFLLIFVFLVVGVLFFRQQVAGELKNNELRVIAAKNSLMPNTEDNPYIIEYGSLFDLSTYIGNIKESFSDVNIEVLVNGNKSTFINTKEVGRYTVNISYSKIDKYNQASTQETVLYYEVKDTQTPEIKLVNDDNEILVLESEEFNPWKLVIYADDPIDGILRKSETLEKGTYTVSSDYEQKPGIYTVAVEAMDNNGLTTKIEKTVTCVKKPEKVEIINTYDDNRIYLGGYTAVLYFGNDQSVTDAPDSANYYPVSNGVIAIADHNYQGFYSAMLNNNTGYAFGKKIHKVATYYGRVNSDYSDIVFDNGGTYETNTDGAICMYTCTDNNGGRLITYWDYD